MKITRETVENYLENYEKSRSNAMDSVFPLFKSDVSRMADLFAKGELYVYEVPDWISEAIERVSTMLKEDNDMIKESIELIKLIEEIRENEIVVIIEDSDRNITQLK